MDILMMPLMMMGSLFVVAPFLALVPAAVFGWLYLLSKRWPNLVAASLWGLYAAYESAMYLRILCSGECNIRIDLLLLYPLLLIISLLAIISSLRWRRAAKNA